MIGDQHRSLAVAVLISACSLALGVRTDASRCTLPTERGGHNPPYHLRARFGFGRADSWANNFVRSYRPRDILFPVHLGAIRFVS